MRHTICTTLLFFVLSCASFGATIPVFGTGLDPSGQFLAAGAKDPHYTLTVNYLENGSNTYVPNGASPAEALAEGVPMGWPIAPSAWAFDPSAQFIAPQVDVVGISGVGFNTVYTYQTTFDLSGLIVNTASLTGHWTGDNYLSQVSLNGVPVYSGGGCVAGGRFSFQALLPFSISSGFQPGANTLSFDVTNDPCGFPPGPTNPTGLLVDIAGVADPDPAAVPEPATALPIAVALGLACFMYRRRHSCAPKP